MQPRKFSDFEVQRMRDMHKQGQSTRQIAKHFETSQSTVQRIVTYQTYARLDNKSPINQIVQFINQKH